jgi:nitrile hydratase
MRAAIEALPPELYLSSSYYKRWALEIENLVTGLGLADVDEIKTGLARHAGKPLRNLTAGEVPNALTRGSYFRPPPSPARFKAGDRVRAKNIHPPTHTRLPRYARGHVGVIEAIRGCHVFPDSSALGAGENPQWLYTVRFEGRELWGETTDPTLTVSIEAFEPYLEAA